MIKIPNAIVIYPQKKSVPGYLLCWIPAREYQRVVVNLEKRAELEKLYPQGIEIELSEDGLKEAGVALEVTPKQLKQAYLDLLEANMIPDTGMIELVGLQDYLAEEQSRSHEEVVAELADQMERFDELDEGDLLRKIASAPPMTEGDEAMQVYRRLDVKQHHSNQGDQGG